MQLRGSVADPGCLSCCHTFFCSHKFHKIEKLFYVWNAEEKNLGPFSKNYRTFYPKICHLNSQNMGFGSGIRDPEKNYSGSRILDPGSGSATLLRGWTANANSAPVLGSFQRPSTQWQKMRAGGWRNVFDRPNWLYHNYFGSESTTRRRKRSAEVYTVHTWDRTAENMR